MTSLATLTAAAVVRGMFDEALAAPEIIVAEVAAKIEARLLAEHPEVLRRYLDEGARRLLRFDLTSLVRSQRAQARSAGPRADFSDIARRRDIVALGIFASPFAVDEAHTVKRLGDMVGAECLFVASSYELSSRADAMQAAFLRAVAKRAGKRRVREAMDEGTCQRLYDSITHPDEVHAK